jgi:hypothetical protein
VEEILDLLDVLPRVGPTSASPSLHSTVLADAVIVGTPNLVAIGQGYSDSVGYVEAGVARPVGNAADIHGAMLDPVPVDPASRAAFIARQFSGGDESERIASINQVVARSPA